LLRRPDIRFILDRVRNQAKRQSLEAELAAMFPAVAFKGQARPL
jgi:hypothetical protein